VRACLPVTAHHRRQLFAGGRVCSHRVHTIQTTAPSVVGFVSFETLDVLFSVDARFKRVFERNYFMLLIAWVKIAVPFLM
jgi:hypothetical protein